MTYYKKVSTKCLNYLIIFNYRSNVKRLTTADFTYTVDGIFDSLYTDRKLISFPRNFYFKLHFILHFSVLLPFRFTTLSITDHHWVFVSCYECDFFGRPPGSNLILFFISLILT